MNSKIPSRRLLRQLTLACNDFPHASPARPPQTKTSCSTRQPHNISSRPALRRAGTVPGCGALPARHSSTSTSTTTTKTAPPTKESIAPSPTAPLPNISNHYTLFPRTLPHGPPPHPNSTFAIPLPSLRREFLQIQSLHHPDKHPTEPAHSKALALSALVNTAYKTLLDPLLRAQYLLQHSYDVDVNSEDNSAHASDADTLMEVMEAQERIEDAETEGQIDEIRAENEKRIEETVEALGNAFERDDVAAATRECIRLRYWRSLGDGLHSWEPGKEVRLIH